MKRQYRSPRGTRDILPDEIGRWRELERTARSTFERYGFREIRTSHLESTDLFARSIGASSDIVRKEMYTIEKGSESLCLRPENTASVVRAFVQHSLHRGATDAFPERYYYIGPMFRYERPQKGRQRQFHQIGVEVLGASAPLADAETLRMLWVFLGAAGLEGAELALSSVGDDACRPAFRQTLVDWLAPQIDTFCEDCQRRFRENPLRVFDCKVEADQRRLAEAPTILDALCAPCREHFDGVRGWLESAGVPFVVDGRMVRGLDYYQRTVFEVRSERLGAQNAVLGGGRYDGLVEELGGPAVPGFGFAIGMERLLELLPGASEDPARPELMVVVLGEAAMAPATALAEALRDRGARVLLPLTPRPMGAQLKRADRVGAGYALFVGEDEVAADRFGLKDLTSGEQQTVDRATLLERFGGRG